MKKSLVVFVGNSTLSIVEQYKLHLQTDVALTFLLPHKNDVVFEKLFHVLQLDPKIDRNALVYTGEVGKSYFIMDVEVPYIKTKREENIELVNNHATVFNELVTQYDNLLIIGESSCSFDAVVMEHLIEQAAKYSKQVHVISWCPIQSQLALENDQALQNVIQTYNVKHTVVTANDEEPDGFLSLFKAYNKEIAKTVHQTFQQQ